ncbi:unnamed protein product [Cunninghamella blakesleeana]
MVYGCINGSPIIVEVQNTIDKKFIRRVIGYCNTFIKKEEKSNHQKNDRGNIENDSYQPFVIIVGINDPSSEVVDNLSFSKEYSYMKILNSFAWAKKVFVTYPALIKNMNINNDKFLALTYFFIKQSPSLHNTIYYDNDTLRLCYQYSGEFLKNYVPNFNEEVNRKLQQRNLSRIILNNTKKMKNEKDEILKCKLLDNTMFISSKLTELLDEEYETCISKFGKENIKKELFSKEAQDFIKMKRKCNASWATIFEEGGENGLKLFDYGTTASLRVSWFKFNKKCSII